MKTAAPPSLSTFAFSGVRWVAGSGKGGASGHPCVVTSRFCERFRVAGPPLRSAAAEVVGKGPLADYLHATSVRSEAGSAYSPGTGEPARTPCHSPEQALRRLGLLGGHFRPGPLPISMPKWSLERSRMGRKRRPRDLLSTRCQVNSPGNTRGFGRKSSA